MYFIPLFLIIIGLAGIGIIVAGKFPQLSNVDIDNLPEEREARKKKEIISRRVQAEGAALLTKLLKRFAFLGRWWGLLQLNFRKYVGKVERLWHHEQHTKKKMAEPTAAPVMTAAQSTPLEQDIQAGQAQLQAGAFAQAEELFIAAIKLDPKAPAAYRGLADTYLAQGSINEAKETYSFLLQLTPDDDKAISKLAEIAETEGKLEEAITLYQQAAVLNDSLSPRFYHLAELLVKVEQPETAKEAILSAVELEPKNPMYLDLLVEIGILCGDKDLAMSALGELRAINPKNPKLEHYAERLRNL